MKSRPAKRPPAAPVPPAAARPAPASQRSDRSFRLVTLSTTAGVLAAFAFGRSGMYTPGDDVGYYMGLAGGLLMLTLLLYPLRKHVAALRNWGKVKHWFAVHMIVGIGGPVLVLAHSTFHMRSTNAAVALICMLVVAASGIAGRFLYTKVHRGLYGEKTNLQELSAAVGMQSAEVRSRLHFAPEVERLLKEFQDHALARREGLAAEASRFLGLALRRFRVERACARELRRTLQAAARERGWDAARARERLKAARGLVEAYVAATQRVASFTTYDRLLQLWHVAHVPLVYLLVLTSIAHVVAVHMY